VDAAAVSKSTPAPPSSPVTSTEGDGTENDAPREFSIKRRLAWFLVLTLLVIGSDQLTKLYAIANWQSTGGPNYTSYAGDLFRLNYAENSGAFLSMMGESSPGLRFWVLTVANALVLVGLGLFILLRKSIDRSSWTALAFITTGGLANLIDRVRLDGIVLDFMNLGWGSVRTGIFNIADIAISAGFLMMLPMMIFGEKEPPKAQPQDAPKGTA